MLRIAIVVGSTRPGRTAVRVAGWVYEIARERDDAEFELVDVADYALPLLAALKNAIDFLYHEWSGKAAGFVGYGNTGGARAIEHLRLVMGELQVADVREQVSLSIFDDFLAFSELRPRDRQVAALHAMLDQVVAWSGALRPLRATV